MRDEADAVHIADAGAVIVATVWLADCDPDQALTAFTDPAVLLRWWRGELTADLVPDGEYTVRFPAIPARLTGRVLGYTPADSLVFSWSWEDEPPDSTVAIRVRAEPDGNGTVLTIEHGPHREDEAGQTAHAEHRAGWEFFLPRLRAAISCGS